MQTMQDFIDLASARRGVAGNQRSSDFLPEDVFKPFVDLDGASAKAFFEANGYTVAAHGDIGTNGVAVTTCGWTLSTNGHLSYNTAYAKDQIARLAGKAA